jgi:DNA-binding transcriptional LysR family regulator
MRGLDLESARLFLVAHQEGSLTRAAEKSHLALPAVTKRIQDLEHVFGVTLFDRHARGVTATPAGEELAVHFQYVLHRLNMASQAMKEFAAGNRGQVRIVATQSAIVGGLADIVAKYSAAFRDIAIDLREVNGWSIVPEIENGRADLGLTISVFDAPVGMSSVSFQDVKLVAMVPADHPLARQRRANFDEMLRFEHVTLGPQSALCSFLVQQAADRRQTFRYRAVQSFDVMRSMIAANLGIGIMSDLMAKPFARKLGTVCLPIEEEWADRQIKVWFREDLMTSAARTFKDILAASKDGKPTF